MKSKSRFPTNLSVLPFSHLTVSCIALFGRGKCSLSCHTENSWYNSNSHVLRASCVGTVLSLSLRVASLPRKSCRWVLSPFLFFLFFSFFLKCLPADNEPSQIRLSSASPQSGHAYLHTFNFSVPKFFQKRNWWTQSCLVPMAGSGEGKKKKNKMKTSQGLFLR